MEIYHYIILEAIISFILAIFIILSYVRKGTNKLVILISLLTWFCDFYLVINLPYDICITNKQKRNLNLTEAEEKTSKIIQINYQIAYWITFCLAWVIIPLLKSYESNGEFTKWEKIKYAIKSNLILYGVVLFICLLLFIWAYFKLAKETISFFFKNIYNFNYILGLSIMLLLLSYSLVKLPKFIYEKINYQKTIQYYEYTAKNINDKLSVVKIDLKEHGHQLLETIEDTKIMQEMTDDKIFVGNKAISSDNKSIAHYQKYMKEKFDYLYQNSKLFDIELKSNSFGTKHEPIKDKKKLVQLINKIMKEEWDDLRLQCQMQIIYSKWSTLKSIIIIGKKNKMLSNSNYSKIGKDKSEKTIIDKLDESFVLLNNISSLKVWYYLKIRRIIIFILTIFFLIFGGIIFISEISISLPWNLSIFSLIISSVTNVLVLHIILFIQIIYLLGMSMYTLFRLKISGYFGMYPHKQTDSVSLLYFSDNINRIIFPLCLNVIMMANKGNDTSKTILESIFGINMQNKVFVFYNNYSPLILILCVLINGFNIFLKLGKCFGIDNFYIESEKRDNDIEEGYNLLMNMNKKSMGKLIVNNTEIKGDINNINSSINIDFGKI
jgi:hypothetical protein